MMKLIKDIQLLMFVFSLEDRHKAKIKSEYQHEPKQESKHIKQIKSYFACVVWGAITLGIVFGLVYCIIEFFSWIGPTITLSGFFIFCVSPVMGLLVRYVYKEFKELRPEKKRWNKRIASPYYNLLTLR